MIRKGQFHYSAGNGLSPAEQVYLLAAKKTGNPDFFVPSPLTRQSLMKAGNIHPFLRLVNTKGTGAMEIARQLSIARSTVYKILEYGKVV